MVHAFKQSVVHDEMCLRELLCGLAGRLSASAMS